MITAIYSTIYYSIDTRNYLLDINILFHPLTMITITINLQLMLCIPLLIFFSLLYIPIPLIEESMYCKIGSCDSLFYIKNVALYLRWLTVFTYCMASPFFIFFIIFISIYWLFFLNCMNGVYRQFLWFMSLILHESLYYH